MKRAEEGYLVVRHSSAIRSRFRSLETSFVQFVTLNLSLDVFPFSLSQLDRYIFHIGKRKKTEYRSPRTRTNFSWIDLTLISDNVFEIFSIFKSQVIGNDSPTNKIGAETREMKGR